MKGRQIKYSEEELSWIENKREMARRESHALFVKQFGRDDVNFSNYKALCTRKGWKTGRTGHYVKGRIPENLGKKMPFNANSAATQFKKGSVPPNALPLWSERICQKDGYVLMKVPRRNPWNGQKTMFMHKQRYLWEEANGPIPDGYALKCLDGDKTNCDLDNWELVDRSLLPRLNSQWGRNFDEAPDHIKPIIFATAKLEQKIADLSKGAA